MRQARLLWVGAYIPDEPSRAESAATGDVETLDGYALAFSPTKRKYVFGDAHPLRTLQTASPRAHPHPHLSPFALALPSPRCPPGSYFTSDVRLSKPPEEVDTSWLDNPLEFASVLYQAGTSFLSAFEKKEKEKFISCYLSNATCRDDANADYVGKLDLSLPWDGMRYGRDVSSFTFYNDYFGDRYAVLSRCRLAMAGDPSLAPCALEFHDTYVARSNGKAQAEHCEKAKEAGKGDRARRRAAQSRVRTKWDAVRDALRDPRGRGAHAAWLAEQAGGEGGRRLQNLFDTQVAENEERIAREAEEAKRKEAEADAAYHQALKEVGVKEGGGYKEAFEEGWEGGYDRPCEPWMMRLTRTRPPKDGATEPPWMKAAFAGIQGLANGEGIMGAIDGVLGELGPPWASEAFTALREQRWIDVMEAILRGLGVDLSFPDSSIGFIAYNAAKELIKGDWEGVLDVMINAIAGKAPPVDGDTMGRELVASVLRCATPSERHASSTMLHSRPRLRPRPRPTHPQPALG